MVISVRVSCDLKRKLTDDDDGYYTLILIDKELSFYCMSCTTGVMKPLFKYKVWTPYKIKYQYNLTQTSS